MAARNGFYGVDLGMLEPILVDTQEIFRLRWPEFPQRRRQLVQRNVFAIDFQPQRRRAFARSGMQINIIRVAIEIGSQPQRRVIDRQLAEAGHGACADKPDDIGERSGLAQLAAVFGQRVLDREQMFALQPGLVRVALAIRPLGQGRVVDGRFKRIQAGVKIKLVA
ncbi:MAG TPA: hypothetical protein VD886_16330 [Herpetosiphonaceae bacterium]|nr:hypothetical protein [Herpetosiphonaceae bacterium]